VKSFLKISLLAAILIVAIFVLTGCGKSEDTGSGNNNNNNGNNNNTNSKSDTAYIEKFKSIAMTDTLEQVNQKLGSEGTLRNAELGAYVWSFSDNTGIEVSFSSSTNKIIQKELSYKNEDIMNNKITVPDLDALKTKVNGGDVTYDKIKQECGNVDGILTKQTTHTSTYRWQKDNNSFVDATFNAQNICTSFMGR
jgi:putative NIF3 family GTP cyclohydrolase 1 type 2